MHNHDDKYPSRPGFEPGTPRLKAPVDTNKPSGPDKSGIRFRSPSCQGASLPFDPSTFNLNFDISDMNKLIVEYLLLLSVYSWPLVSV